MPNHARWYDFLFSSSFSFIYSVCENGMVYVYVSTSGNSRGTDSGFEGGWR